METLNNLWNYVKPYMPLIIQVIIMPILIPIIRSLVAKIVGKKFDEAMNEKKIEKSYQRAFEDVLAKIKEVSFKQNIQPILNSTLDSIQENALSMFKDELDLNKEITKENIVLFKHFIDMFKSSVMSNPEIQAQLEEDFANIICLIENNENKAIETNVVIEDKEKPKKNDKANNGIMEI